MLYDWKEMGSRSLGKMGRLKICKCSGRNRTLFLRLNLFLNSNLLFTLHIFCDN